jgi:hypothetical protein
MAQPPIKILQQQGPFLGVPMIKLPDTQPISAAGVTALARLRAEELQRISTLPELPLPNLQVPPSHPRTSYRGLYPTHGFNTIFVDENQRLTEENKILRKKIKELELKIQDKQTREIRKLEYDLEEAKKGC